MNVTEQLADLVMGPDGKGTPWEEMHCAQLALVVQQRLGREPFEPGLWSLAIDGVDERELWRRIATEEAGPWSEATPPYRVGDVIVSHTDDPGCPVHIATVVVEAPCQVISTSRARGVAIEPARAHLMRAGSVYRWRGAQ